MGRAHPPLHSPRSRHPPPGPPARLPPGPPHFSLLPPLLSWTWLGIQPILVSSRNSKRAGVARGLPKSALTVGALGSSHSQSASTLCQYMMTCVDDSGSLARGFRVKLVVHAHRAVRLVHRRDWLECPRHDPHLEVAVEMRFEVHQDSSTSTGSIRREKEGCGLVAPHFS